MRRTVTLINTTTYGAGARRVSRVNQFHDNPDETCLVFDKATELVECPRVMLPPLALANRGPVPDTLKVFEGDTATGVFGLCNNSLAEHVVDIAGKACLFARTFYQESLGCLRAVRLELLAQFGMALSQAVHLAARVGLTIGVGGDIDDAKVNTQKAFRVIRLRLRGIHHDGQVEGAVSQCKVGLSDNSVYPGFLVGTNAHRNELPSLEGKDGYPIRPLPGKDTLVIDYSAMGLEGVDFGFIPTIALDDLTDNPDGHLCRKAVMLAKIAIGKAMEFHLRSRIPLKSKIGYVVAGLVEAFHSLQQGLMLFEGWREFDHQCLFHSSIIDSEYQYVKGGKPAILYQLKQMPPSKMRAIAR